MWLDFSWDDAQNRPQTYIHPDMKGRPPWQLHLARRWPSWLRSRPHAYQNLHIDFPHSQEVPLQGVCPPRFLPEKLSCCPLNERKPVLIGLDWLLSKTFGPFHLIATHSRMNQHQDSAKSATNRLESTVVWA